MSVDAAIAKARGRAMENVGPQTPSATTSGTPLPAKATTMTMARYEALAGMAPAPMLPGNTMVQVVTVHGHMAMDSLPGQAPRVADVFTEVYNAQTGYLLVTSIGHDVVK